jgi:hypothetical protein
MSTQPSKMVSDLDLWTIRMTLEVSWDDGDWEAGIESKWVLQAFKHYFDSEALRERLKPRAANRVFSVVTGAVKASRAKTRITHLS